MSEPCTFVIFGATGNLSQKKLLPALYHLEEAGRLPHEMAIVGFGRRDWSSEDWRKEVATILEPRARRGLEPEVFGRFAGRLRFFPGDLTDPDAYGRLKRMLEEDAECPDNLVFYMAIRPAEFGLVAQHLADVGLNKEDNG